ncbi:NAD-dependent epimerase/dehydratase family protein [Bosea caraganae]|uniref:NAD-dependent epimerase/dehydratase family protein n=1 Tax=Bosea caraganae TaxID=2763117 RepID=A0A370L447_9HYPH|nr:NAD-dependent epimerase/dehydratase family protein [Bosea caraganae]RDJ23118.1 NAD-dependent epimerase/dehydratase family protein [Bosea caraganae]RDJ28897.1 NAD-dependent epimerase/dehydratase family protein [Bosea caraganae]
MKVLIFGATGMVGQGVLRECLLDDGVRTVVTVGRHPTGQKHPKLREIIHADLLNYRALEGRLSGFDACFFCLGVASAGMSEADYSRITYDIPLAAAQALLPRNPEMTFVHVSGGGADSSEQGRVMWARVKGKAENALLRLPFKAVYVLRPGAIRPMHGIKSSTRAYRIIYSLLAPILPLLERRYPQYVTSTECVGRTMLTLARDGTQGRILDCADINRIATLSGG